MPKISARQFILAACAVACCAILLLQVIVPSGRGQARIENSYSEQIMDLAAQFGKVLQGVADLGNLAANKDPSVLSNEADVKKAEDLNKDAKTLLTKAKGLNPPEDYKSFSTQLMLAFQAGSRAAAGMAAAFKSHSEGMLGQPALDLKEADEDYTKAEKIMPVAR